MLKQLKESFRRNHAYYLGLSSGQLLLVANAVAQLIVVPVYLSQLGKYEFGVISILVSVVNLGAFGITWLTGGCTRILSENAARRNWRDFQETYTIAKLTALAYGALLAAAMIGVSQAFGQRIFGAPSGISSNELLLTVAWAAAYTVALYSFVAETLVFVATKRQMEGNLVQLINPVVFVAIVVPWLSHGGKLHVVFVAMTAGYLTATLSAHLYWLLRRHAEERPRLRRPRSSMRPILRRLMGRAGAGYTTYGALTLILNSDVLLLGWLGGAGVAGDFSVLWKIPNLLVQILWRIPAFLEPYIMHHDAKDERAGLSSLYEKGERWYLLATLSAGIGFAIFGHLVLTWWVGSGQAPQEALAYWLAGLAVFWLSAVRWPISFLYALVQFRKLLPMVSAELVLKIVVILLVFGYVGYLAPLVAINVEFLLGLFFIYFRVVRSEVRA